MNRKILVVAGVLGIAAGAAIWFGRGAFTDAGAADDAAARRGRRAGDAARGSAKPARPARIAEARLTAQGSASSATSEAEASDNDSELSAEDERRIDEIQTALDEEKLTDVKSLAEKLIDHPSAAVRQKAVEALQWFGEKALDTLTPYLADADEDVRTSAMDAAEQSLLQIEDEKAKLDYIESLFQIRGACDEDGLTMLGGQLKGLSDGAAVAAAAVRVIEANRDPAAAKEMREVYEFVTGEPYTTPDAAQRWLRESADAPEL
jgi:hypothetical protein